MLEKEIEKKGGEYAAKKGVMHLKFTSPARASVPDRLLLAKMPEFMIPVIARYIRFVEYKREGCKPTPAQEREHARLRALGFTVDVIDHVVDARLLIDEMGD